MSSQKLYNNRGIYIGQLDEDATRVTLWVYTQMVGYYCKVTNGTYKFGGQWVGNGNLVMTLL